MLQSEADFGQTSKCIGTRSYLKGAKETRWFRLNVSVEDACVMRFDCVMRDNGQSTLRRMVFHIISPGEVNLRYANCHHGPRV